MRERTRTIQDLTKRFRVGQIYQIPNCIITREIERIDTFYITTIWRRKDRVAKRTYYYSDNPLKPEFLIRDAEPIVRIGQLTLF